MFFDILTLFPAMFSGVFSDSIIRRAIDNKLITIELHNIRDYSDNDRHKTVDDYPYGGDAGMVLMPGPVARAITAARERLAAQKPQVVLFTPRGEMMTQEVVKSLLAHESLILLCGRYKGVDERISERYVDRELSLGDFVISGGEIAAMALVDAVTRLLPGALGNQESAQTDSFYNGLLSHPEYTRPEEFEGLKVPPVLLSGHHAKIAAWQREMAIEITKRRRPDLWERFLKIETTVNNNNPV
jgi:tRNA (guanine37-N1)-methyltransferase